MRVTASKFILILASGLALNGCAPTQSTPASAPAAGGPVGGAADRERNEGYSLLDKLLSDEASVSDILIVKHADNSVSGLVKEIAAACGAAKNRMTAFRKLDRGLHYDLADLPTVEQKSRELESAVETRKLLDLRGSEFEVRLIVTQIEAMGYAADLAKALEAHEVDPIRKTFLTSLSDQCEAFRERLEKMLTTRT
jgi:hypothetical protein